MTESNYPLVAESLAFAEWRSRGPIGTPFVCERLAMDLIGLPFAWDAVAAVVADANFAWQSIADAAIVC